MMLLLKCCTQYASKFGKLSSGHRTGKSQFSFQSQRKAMLKSVQNYMIGISNFLKRFLVCPILLFPLFLCIVHLGRLSYLSLLFFVTLHSNGYIFPFLLCLQLLFFSQLFIRPPQTTILPFFFLWMVLIPVSCTMSQTSIHSSSGTLSIRSSPLNLFLTSTV